MATWYSVLVQQRAPDGRQLRARLRGAVGFHRSADYRIAETGTAGVIGALSRVHDKKRIKVKQKYDDEDHEHQRCDYAKTDDGPFPLVGAVVLVHGATVIEAEWPFNNYLVPVLAIQLQPGHPVPDDGV